MGYSLWWMIARGVSAERVHRALGLEATDRVIDGHPLEDGHERMGIELASGAYVVVHDGFPFDDDRASVLAALSASPGVELFVASQQDTSGYVGADAWSDGRRVWSAEHSEDGLRCTGELPEELRARIAAKDAQRAAWNASLGGGFVGWLRRTFSRSPINESDVPHDALEAITGFDLHEHEASLVVRVRALRVSSEDASAR